MRIPLPVALIREMDAIIVEGVGGYSTRAEFILDAIQERILELTIEGVEDAGLLPMLQDVGSAPLQLTHTPAAPQSLVDSSLQVTMQMTELTPPAAGFIIPAAHDLSRPEGKALFGLHNRDYPALWALDQLAAMTTEEAIPIVDFFARILEAAWEFGMNLLALEKQEESRFTTLFPTNPGKQKSAETRFLAFAIGDYRADSAGTIDTSGPLFEWRTVGLSGSASEPSVGLTASGWQLLADLKGLSVEQPHAPSCATTFLNYLKEYAPGDERGFIEIMRAIGPSGATRESVLNHVGAQWPEWTENEVSTNAGGYIARTREWGFVEPKQSKSHYHLTPLGLEHLGGEQQ